MLNIEIRFVIELENIVCMTVCNFQPGNLTCWGREGVKGSLSGSLFPRLSRAGTTCNLLGLIGWNGLSSQAAYSGEPVASQPACGSEWLKWIVQAGCLQPVVSQPARGSDWLNWIVQAGCLQPVASQPARGSDWLKWIVQSGFGFFRGFINTNF